MRSTKQFQPQLAAREAPDLDALRYPILASPKLDGFRALCCNGHLFSRTLKPIRNRALRELLSHVTHEGWDGELIYGDPTAHNVFNVTSSKVTTHNEGTDGVVWHIFDRWDMPTIPFNQRYETLPEHWCGPHIKRLPQYLIHGKEELLLLEAQMVELGYEGLILRDPTGRYKYGRSTLCEAIMLKLKRFTDAEGVVLGFEELMHNANIPQRDERGYAKRSSHASGKVGMERLGALVVSFGSRTVKVGTGFTSAERVAIWRERDRYRGRLVKYRFQEAGTIDLPRCPKFVGWRDEEDV